jgi:hypothetical protein
VSDVDRENRRRTIAEVGETVLFFAMIPFAWVYGKARRLLGKD